MTAFAELDDNNVIFSQVESAKAAKGIGAKASFETETSAQEDAQQ